MFLKSKRLSIRLSHCSFRSNGFWELFMHSFCTLLDVNTLHCHIRAADLACMCNPTRFRTKLKSLWHTLPSCHWASACVNTFRVVATVNPLPSSIPAAHYADAGSSKATQREKSCAHGLMHQLSTILCPQCWYLSHLLRSSLTVENYGRDNMSTSTASVWSAIQISWHSPSGCCVCITFSPPTIISTWPEAGSNLDGTLQKIKPGRARTAGVSPPGFVN